MNQAAAPSSKTFRDWSVADDYAKAVHPRWEELKARGNEALLDGDFEGAECWYNDALAVCDGRLSVWAFFDVLSERCAANKESAAQRLVGARADIEPLIRHHMATPVLEEGQPNKPAAICAAPHQTPNPCRAPP